MEIGRRGLSRFTEWNVGKFVPSVVIGYLDLRQPADRPHLRTNPTEAQKRPLRSSMGCRKGSLMLPGLLMLLMTIDCRESPIHFPIDVVADELYVPISKTEDGPSRMLTSKRSVLAI